MKDDKASASGSAVSVWDGEARCYDASRQADPVYLSCIRQTVNRIPESARMVLDAGCGTGLSTVALNSPERIVVAADYSLESLKILQKKKLPNVLIVQADLAALPFKDGVFDGCVCANTLQHFKPDGPQENAVSQLLRVTGDRGTVSVSAHHFSVDKQKAGWIKEGKPGQAGIDYIFRFSRAELEALLPGAILRAVGYYGLARLPLVGRQLQDVWAKLFARIAGRLGYGHMLNAAVRKGRR